MMIDKPTQSCVGTPTPFALPLIWKPFSTVCLYTSTFSILRSFGSAVI